MKLGAENRTETIIAAVLGVIALLMVLRGFVFSPSPKATAAPARAAAPAAAAPAGNRGKAAPVLTQSLDPRLRLDLLTSSEQVKYVGKGRNIFRAEAEPVKIEQPKFQVFKNKQPEGPPPPPPPPPIPLKYFGLASRPGEPTRIFLSEGDNVFVAREGEIVDRRYKIVRVTPNQVEVEDMLYNNRQSIPLSQG